MDVKQNESAGMSACSLASVCASVLGCYVQTTTTSYRHSFNASSPSGPSAVSRSEILQLSLVYTVILIPEDRAVQVNVSLDISGTPVHATQRSVQP